MYVGMYVQFSTKHSIAAALTTSDTTVTLANNMKQHVHTNDNMYNTYNYYPSAALFSYPTLEDC